MLRFFARKYRRTEIRLIFEQTKTVNNEDLIK